MIIVYHQNNKVVEVDFGSENIVFSQKSIASVLFEIAQRYSDELIIWCRNDFRTDLNYSRFQNIFHHKKIMASYNVSGNTFLPETLGYVDQALFLNVKKDVSYPTWLMSSDIGGIHASVLNLLKGNISEDSSFDYFLTSMAKQSMFLGLQCYSEPLLLKDSPKYSTKNENNNYLLFRFVKQHYRTRWVFILFLNFLLYEKKFAFLSLITSFGYKRRILNEDILDDIAVQSGRKVIDKKTIDVIIPTIGRKNYLYDVLLDLSKQSYLPENVIIIEQNPNLNSSSELDYLYNENWPFKIKHTFTHQAGACNARNLALAEVTSEWVFLNDDDNRFESDLIEKTFKNIDQYGCLGALAFYPREGQKLVERKTCQASIFGSGNSFINATALHKVKFNMSLEFGYGEDAEFGLQLRKIGFDIIYFPDIVINHLSAPMGGFRTKPVLAWKDAIVQPKPSPTIMFVKVNNLTLKQFLGYKTLLFLKFYKVQNIKNPIKYFFNFREQWKVSLFWAEELKNKSKKKIN